jgi:predicted DNA-binding transcriptional regulator AlpA
MKFLLRSDLRDRGIKFTNKHLLHMERTGKFPKRTYLGPRTPAWTEPEIDAHQAALLAERDAPPKAA